MNDNFNNAFMMRGGADYSNDIDVQKDINILRELEGLKPLAIKLPDGQLLDYQIPHAEKLISILKENVTALDASEPGIGKTYIASHVAKVLKGKVIVICPKNVVNKWIEVLDKFNVEILFVSNYELVTRGKHLKVETGDKVDSKYVKVNTNKKK